jgi:glycosyltransferase involved in cell wall biosynthesis
MKIGIYSPYLDSFGGGERYCLALAAHWSKIHDVRIFWGDSGLGAATKKRLNIDITRAHIVPNIFKSRSLWIRFLETRPLDCLFVLTDGSMPMSFARRNILHLQVPFARVDVPEWKLGRYQAVVCNSEFTRANIDPRLRARSTVIFPPVAPIAKGRKKKAKMILSVGRFSNHYQAKKQHVLIEAFIDAQNKGTLTGWKLVLAGGLLPSDEKYFSQLKKRSSGYAIELVANSAHSQLTSLYNEASIYWHAAGFGETDPKRMEHFGIATVEAMSAGCVPIVFNGGGQPEILNKSTLGFLWDTKEELIAKTEAIIQDEKKMQRIAEAAKLRASAFSVETFGQSFDGLLSKLFV